MMSEDSHEVHAVEAELLDSLNQLRAIHGGRPLTKLPEPPYCSFCGRSKEEVGALVEGIGAHICVDCAEEARRLLLRV
jgi:hypothetical protein